ncbi:hypothetical protein [Streptomyces griseus]|uniref:hypothetical protein n=1 Tax=Streptomyces griseus TaxID=1911 RepID=UPI003789353E
MIRAGRQHLMRTLADLAAQQGVCIDHYTRLKPHQARERRIGGAGDRRPGTEPVSHLVGGELRESQYNLELLVLVT